MSTYLLLTIKQATSGLRFFGLDCRPREHLAAGKFPTGYHFDPARLEDPEEIQRLMATLEPFKGSMHIILMGAGDRSGFVSSNGFGIAEKTMAIRMREQLQRAARDDIMHINNCALFLIKRGFPYVSIVDGGYVAVHTYLMHRGGGGYGVTPRSPTINPLPPLQHQHSALGLNALIDHTPANCRMCKHEALLRFHREQALADAYGTSSSADSQPSLRSSTSTPSSSLSDSITNSSNQQQQPPPSLGSLSSGPFGLGQSLDSFKTRASGLFGKLAAGGNRDRDQAVTIATTPTATTAAGSRSSSGGIEGSSGGGNGGGGGGGIGIGGGGGGKAGSIDVHEVGNFLKDTLGQLTKRAEQAIASSRSGAGVPLFSTAGVGAGAGGSGATNNDAVRSPLGRGGGLLSPRQQQHPMSPPGGGGSLGQSIEGGKSTSISTTTTSTTSQQSNKAEGGGGSVFVIEDDDLEDEDDEDHERDSGRHPSPLVSPSSGGGGGEAIMMMQKRRNDLDRELALKQHMVNGLQKGQEVIISPESLPGAELFPVYKQKHQQQAQADGESTNSAVRVVELSRYIALTPERMLVLETVGGLTAALGRVKSNHHLTELAKMTFMRKDPEVVTLYFRVGGGGLGSSTSGGMTMTSSPQQLSSSSPSSPATPAASSTSEKEKEELKKRAYRIARKEEFISVLQEKLQRFK